MPTWVTHFMVADRVLEKIPALDIRGFFVGTVAPDCYTGEDEQSTFRYAQQVMHWKERSFQGLCGRAGFFAQYIQNRKLPREEFAFLLGYYAHLLVDEAYQKMVRRIARPQISPEQRGEEVLAIEGAYLLQNPDSGYLTCLLPLEEFPDYLDYLPPGSITRRIGLVGYQPPRTVLDRKPVFIPEEEYLAFVADGIEQVLAEFKERDLI